MTKKITLQQVLQWRPCYPEEQVRQWFQGREALTLSDLKALDIPNEDKLWCLLHEEVMSKTILHSLACDFAERALSQERNTDERSWNAIKTKRRWLQGEASDDELEDAHKKAWAAWREAEKFVSSVETRWAERAATEAARGVAELWTRDGVGEVMREAECCVRGAALASRRAVWKVADATEWESKYQTEIAWQLERAMSVADAVWAAEIKQRDFPECEPWPS